MAFLSLLSNAFSALSGWFGFAKQRDAERNTAAVQAGAIRAQDQAATDAASRTIATGDVTQIRKDLSELILIIGLTLAAAGLVGCASTITPPLAQATVASWDTTNQNSGFLAFTTNTAGQVTGALITAHARDRYNTLMAVYGRQWQVTHPDEGLTPRPDGSWAIDAQHLQYFILANRERNNGRVLN